MIKPAFSFEFFPAKTEQGQEKLLSTYDELNKLSPAYFSVTYGAGGSTRGRTLDIVQALCARGDYSIFIKVWASHAWLPCVVIYRQVRSVWENCRLP